LIVTPRSSLGRVVDQSYLRYTASVRRGQDLRDGCGQGVTMVAWLIVPCSRGFVLSNFSFAICVPASTLET
jgi:hypothetical protein